MTGRSLTATVAVVALTATGCGGESNGRSASARAVTPPRPTVITASRAARDGVPQATRRLASIPRPGTVALAAGPFNDKLRVGALMLRRAQRPQVSGRMLTTSDVSEVLALTIQVAFYDRHGSLVATGQHSRQNVKEFFDKPLHFRLRSSQPAPTAVTAVVSIPEYVPE